MKAKQIIKSAGYRIKITGNHRKGTGWPTKKTGEKLHPVILIMRPYGDGITVSGKRRQIGGQIKAFARALVSL